MKMFADCIPCFMSQALTASRMATDDSSVHDRVLRMAAAALSETDPTMTPPEMAQVIHRIIRTESGVADPYAEVKEEFNAFALKLYPELKRTVAESLDPFETAVRLAIAGNIIDFGASNHLKDDAVTTAIQESLQCDLDRRTLTALREEIAAARTILYLCDNTGEIVFDRVLIEELPLERVTAVVRGAPVINDATMSDAEDAGLNDLVRVIGNGTDAPGTILEQCDAELRCLFDAADVIIAKGQGNYETLSDVPRPIYHVLRIKCPVIARDVECDVGSSLVTRRA